MFPTAVSHSPASLYEEDASVRSGTRVQNLVGLNQVVSTVSPNQQPQKIKRKRSLPGNPDPEAEVIALSPKTLLATNRFVCEICHKGFQREQNLQLHRRGHNLPWKLKQRSSNEVVKKKAYVCPEPSCVHHNPTRALGDLTGIKKHYCRKHGEKKWNCNKCSKIYAVQSDWKAHSKICGNREYRCDCGTIFCRKDSFITHRAFCDAWAEESVRLSATQLASATNPLLLHSLFLSPTEQNFQNHITNFSPSWDSYHESPNPNIVNIPPAFHIKPEAQTFHDNPTTFSSPPTLLQQLQSHHEHHHPKHMTASNLHVPSFNSATSATALLQEAATFGAITGPGSSAAGIGVGVVQQQQHSTGHGTRLGMGEFGTVSQLDSVMMGMRELKSDRLTRDFLGLTVDATGGGADGGNCSRAVDIKMDVNEMLTYAGSVEFHQAHHIRQRSFLNPQQQGFGFLGTNNAPETWENC